MNWTKWGSYAERKKIISNKTKIYFKKLLKNCLSHLLMTFHDPPMKKTSEKNLVLSKSYSDLRLAGLYVLEQIWHVAFGNERDSTKKGIAGISCNILNLSFRWADFENLIVAAKNLLNFSSLITTLSRHTKPQHYFLEFTTVTKKNFQKFIECLTI